MKQKIIKLVKVLAFGAIIFAINLPLVRTVGQSFTTQGFQISSGADPNKVDCWDAMVRGGSNSWTICSFELMGTIQTCKVVNDLSWWDGLNTCESTPPPTQE